MIRILNGEPKTFVLDTARTSYVFAVTESGHLEHLFYGAKIAVEKPEDCQAFREKKEFEIGNAIAYSKLHPKVLLEDMCLEMSSGGHGDVREPFVALIYPDGSRSSDFLFDSCEMTDTPPVYENLPLAYTDSEEHLCVTLKDGDLTLELHYRVFADCDVITRSARLINSGKEPVRVERLMSMQLDLPLSGCGVTSFHGAWAREMNRSTTILNAGKFVVEARTGCSSNRTSRTPTSAAAASTASIWFTAAATTPPPRSMPTAKRGLSAVSSRRALAGCSKPVSALKRPRRL